MIKAIREATVTALTTAGYTAHNALVLSQSPTTFPVVCVYSDSISGQNDGMKTFGSYQDYTLSIEVLTAGADSPDQLDDITENIIDALFGDDTYRALWSHIQSYDVQMDYQRTAEQILGTATIKITGTIFRND